MMVHQTSRCRYALLFKLRVMRRTSFGHIERYPCGCRHAQGAPLYTGIIISIDLTSHTGQYDQ